MEKVRKYLLSSGIVPSADSFVNTEFQLGAERRHGGDSTKVHQPANCIMWAVCRFVNESHSSQLCRKPHSDSQWRTKDYRLALRLSRPGSIHGAINSIDQN